MAKKKQAKAKVTTVAELSGARGTCGYEAFLVKLLD